jgi:exodeoxyribonuclease V alpha subunit
VTSPDKEADGAQIEGTLERIVFQNPENHWTVARFSVDGDEVAVVGNLIGVQTGASLLMRGQWVDDRRFGRQFKVAHYQTQTPQTLLGIERYLSSGFIPGIGDGLAKRIVARFGLKTFDVIANSPDSLTEVEGIGPSRAKKIADAWVDQKAIQDVMVFLRGHGVSAAYAARIYKRYGADAISVVRSNPYRLALDIWGIGFKSADAIAQELGIARDAGERIEAGLVHVLGKLSDDGHTHAPRELVIKNAAELLELDESLIPPAIDRLRVSQLVTSEDLGSRGHHLSLTTLHQCEVEAAQYFCEIARSAGAELPVDFEAYFAEYQNEQGIELAAQQKLAIRAGITDKCTVITGGPGVGKTTIVRCLVQLFSRHGQLTALAAPTGRAAKRLGESTGRNAFTLHRLLDFQPQSGRFERNSHNPIEADVIIVDEASMVDTALFRSLVAATPLEARLILVGDIDQLPSVGPGAVLSDLIGSGAPTVVKLTEIFRQAAASQIVVNAHRVNRGELPNLEAPAGNAPDRSDFYFVERDDPIAARETLLDLVAKRIPDRFGFDPIADVQVLTPMHRGDLGTTVLNQALQARLTDESRKGLRRGQHIYRPGDKVMQIRNDYDKDIFNGDMGIIRSVDSDEGTLLVEMLDGREIHFERGELDDLSHAFAVSVHKSQGSEYPCVILPLLTQHYMMLQRNLLYTAITRGKELVVLLGSRRAVKMAVHNQDSRLRYTYLGERIRQRMAAEA